VIQEVALASDVVIICGENSIPWAYLAYAARFIEENSLHNAISEAYGRSPSGLGNCLEIDAYKVSRLAGFLFPFEHLICPTTYFDCADPRDKFYALLGIASEGEDKVFEPDYHSPVEGIFTRNTQILLERSDSLLSLTGIGQDRALHSLPSWVPDLSTQTLGTSLSFRTSFFRIASLIRPKVRTVKSREGCNLLSISGGIIDTVHNLGLNPQDAAVCKEGKKTSKVHLCPKDAMEISKALSPYPTGESSTMSVGKHLSRTWILARRQRRALECFVHFTNRSRTQQLTNHLFMLTMSHSINPGLETILRFSRPLVVT
jgi:hypothetical protein